MSDFDGHKDRDEFLKLRGFDGINRGGGYQLSDIWGFIVMLVKLVGVIMACSGAFLAYAWIVSP